MSSPPVHLSGMALRLNEHHSAKTDEGEMVCDYDHGSLETDSYGDQTESEEMDSGLESEDDGAGISAAVIAEPPLLMAPAPALPRPPVLGGLEAEDGLW